MRWVRPTALAVLLGLGLAAPAPSDDGEPVSDYARPRLVAQTGHGTSPWVGTVAFSPDGRWIVTGGSDVSAILWDTGTGAQVKRFVGHTEPVCSVIFHPDGDHFLTGSYDDTAVLWRVSMEEPVRRFEGHTDDVSSLALAPDGASLLTGSDDGTACIWRIADGQQMQCFAGHEGPIVSICCSSDGRRVLTGGWDGTSRLWDVETGKEIRRFSIELVRHEEPAIDFTRMLGRVESVALSHDGATALTGTNHGYVTLWDTETGDEIRRWRAHPALGTAVNAVAYAKDDRRVLTAGNDWTARLWDLTHGREIWESRSPDGGTGAAVFSSDERFVVTAETCGARLLDADTGHELRRFVGRSVAPTSIAVAPGGERLLFATYNALRLWDGRAGGGVRRVASSEPSNDLLTSVSCSSDGRWILAVSGSAHLIDATTLEEATRFSRALSSAAFTSDARTVVTTGESGTELWELPSGRRLMALPEATGVPALSPDGKTLWTGTERVLRRWDTTTGEVTYTSGRFMERILCLAISPRRDHLAVGALVHTVPGSPRHEVADVLGSGGKAGFAALLDSESGKPIQIYLAHEAGIKCLAFSPDGDRLLTGSYDQTAAIWDVASGEKLLALKGHLDELTCVAFFPDGRRVVTGSEDGTLRIWDAYTGRELCRLILLSDDTWAVVDAVGRYDASGGGNVEGLHWLIGDDIVSLEQLKDRYYDPNLLAKHLGLSSEPLREVAAFDTVKLFPQIDVERPTPEQPRAVVHLRNRGGGIGKVVVLVNGKEMASDARSGRVSPDAPEARVEVDLSSDPRVIPGKTNTLQVFAYNAKGDLRSRGRLRKWKAPGEVRMEPPHLWAIVCGSSDYRGEALDLKYAAKDAEDFASALRLGARRLLGDERVHVTVLSTSGVEGTVRPTRKNLVGAFEAARQASPEDVFVLYLSGHGVSGKGQDADFYYVMPSAASAAITDQAVRDHDLLSSTELFSLIQQVPAVNRQVMVLDTCASGRLVERLTESRTVPGSQVRALERLKDRTGLYVLAGCAADRVSYEASRYGQGLLTYSLLLGMKGGALREEEYVDVSGLFNFAADRVPELARDIGGVQRPILAVPRAASSFDLGRLTAEDRELVPLATVKPIFLRSAIQEERRPRDTLGLSKLVDVLLGDAASRGPTPALVFFDAREFPNAYEIGGRYRVEGDSVTVEVYVFRGEEDVGTFEVKGLREDAETLAERIVEGGLKAIR